MSAECDTHCPHAEEIARDRWGRPLINSTPFTRVSTVAKTLDDQSNLIAWSGGQVSIGMSLPHSDDLREAALLNRGDNGELKKIQEAAKERAGSSAPATRGTSLHSAVSRTILGEKIEDLSPSLTASLNAFFDKLAELDLKIEQTEQFVASEKYGVAGTYDLLVRDARGRLYLADLKTGAKSWERKFPVPVAIQLAAYQAGARYCPRLGEIAPHEANDRHGLLVSLPIDRGECHVDVVDLEVGRRGLELALEVREFRKLKPAREAVPA